MNPISVSLSTYVLAIIFALLIALVIKGMAAALEKFGLGGDEALDITVPTSNSMKEEESIAVAIAVARAQRK
jgi:Na+-transporting methylmalonyl-CoA/oxaloacetate decarboxylase gamma subunit